MRASVPPALSVVICTRDRPHLVSAAIDTIFANSFVDFECVVLDQSTTHVTRDLVAKRKINQRLRYYACLPRGLSAARNAGLALTGAPIIAFADDDCTFPADWLATLVRIAQQHPDAAVIYTAVLAGQYNSDQGYVPTYPIQQPRTFRHIAERHHAGGIGAGLVVRRDAITALGGFDEMLGAGGRFRSAEDFDLTSRALLAGYAVYETNETAVIHHGYRALDDLAELTRRDWFGIGAAAAKLLKAGHWRALPAVLHDGFVRSLIQPLSALLQLQLPRGLRRFVFFWQGFIAGWRTPLDRERLLFR